MPPFIAFSIGSFGDILAVLQLLYKLRDALNELTGAAAEMRVLTDDIDRMTRALIQVKAALERRGSQIQPDVANGIRVAVATCEDILRAALSAIEGFKRRIISATGAAGWRAYCAVIGWSVLGGKQRVDALRARLLEQIDVVQLYLALSQSCAQVKIQESLEAQGATLRRLCDVVQDIQLRFDVGIPSFMFWDQANRKYCAPLARTSLARFREIYEHYTGHPCSDLLPPEGGNAVRRLSLRFVALGRFSEDAAAIFYATPENHSPHIECFLFKENAFGQWQALVGRPYDAKDVADYASVIRILLERPHGPRGPCNCNAESCRSRLQQLFERRALFRQRLDVYEAAACAIAKSIFDEKPRFPAAVHNAAHARPDSVHNPAHEHPTTSDSARIFGESLWGFVMQQLRCDLDPEAFWSAVRKLSPCVLETLIYDLPRMVRTAEYPVVIKLGKAKIRFTNPVECLLDMI